jgi:hypothetical protein
VEVVTSDEKRHFLVCLKINYISTSGEKRQNGRRSGEMRQKFKTDGEKRQT